MNHTSPGSGGESPTPLSPLPLHSRPGAGPRVLTTRQLREHGVDTSETAERCRPGGPWQQVLPGVHLLHPGPPTSEERLHAVLLYAANRQPAVPAQGGTATEGGPMITGLAALALHRFSSAPPLLSLDRIEVLVPRTRRLRTIGFARVVRAQVMPRPQQITGVPVAPVPRALADAVGGLTDACTVRRLLTEAVRGGHCEATAVVREFSQARLLNQPHVVDAVDALLAEGRALAEGRLYELVREYGLPDPLWNVELRLPGGPHLGGVDAYWPEQAVAVEIDARAPRQDEDALWSEYARKREHLERLGITVVHVTPRTLRDAPEQQAAVVRTALMAADDEDPGTYVVVLPR
ncbi:MULTISPECIES: hypothetical protein [Streptomyces]|uniref:hypothetical protein n=1 Tax=Streptomyces TaxID=1883 RepID=UPI0004C9F1A9|nr:MULTISPECIES: hypothetical protein [Streptomyces]KOT63602.1 hypothetical protein ADK43_08175 [Streptomyces rimosus subsp. rimosus]KOT75141.1 hypothetical protein ADK70_40150 [Streptomyces rimosus subsp. pseudoverticillatus]RSO06159.1 hypothetical protein DMH18_28965 [Streptomyces sp. WAC 06783]RSO39121.1 hypothetical protein DMH15_16900 [Streptomyces sp. WAC 06725]